MGFFSLNVGFSPSNHLPLDSRCINGCATLGSPFREFPVFPFYISHPSRAPRRCHLLSLFSCSALASSHPTPTPSPSPSVCPTALHLDCSNACTRIRELSFFSKLKGETEFTWPSAKASVNPTNISKHQTHRCWWEHSFKQLTGFGNNLEVLCFWAWNSYMHQGKVFPRVWIKFNYPGVATIIRENTRVCKWSSKRKHRAQMPPAEWSSAGQSDLPPRSP